MLAQFPSDSTSYLSITSNFDSLYVVVDHQFQAARKVTDTDLIPIPAGKHAITFQPEFSDPYTFRGNFEPDSFYVTRIYFKNILDQQNENYGLLESGQESKVELKKQSKEASMAGSFVMQQYTRRAFFYRGRNEQAAYENSYLKINSNADWLYVSSLGTPNRIERIASGDSVRIMPGQQLVTLAHPQAGEWSFTANFSENYTTVINHNFDLRAPSVSTLQHNVATGEFYNANLLIISDEDSKISVNGLYAGKGAAKVQAQTGPVQIKIENPYTGTRTMTTKIANLPQEPATVVDAYTKPSRAKARFLGLLPGASQFYKNQPTKGALFSGGFLTLTGASVYTNDLYKQELAEYNSIKNRYNQEADETAAMQLGNQLEQQHETMTSRDNLRLAFFAATALFYGFNLYDALTSRPESGYRGQTDLDIYLNSEPLIGQKYSTISVSMKYGF